jgi:hypothetical protein
LQLSSITRLCIVIFAAISDERDGIFSVLRVF